MNRLLICTMLLLMVGCETRQPDSPELPHTSDSHPQTTEQRHSEPELQQVQSDSIYVDLDGDGQKEYLWIEQPELSGEDMECKGECTCIIRSSSIRFQPYTLDNCINGLLVEEGDLDGDGREEIGLLPDWFTSCWRGYYLLKWKDGNWKLLVKPMDVYVCDEYPIEQFAAPSRKGFINVMVFDLINDRMGVIEEIPCNP